MPAPRRSNAEVARLLAIRITQQVQRGAGKGLAAAVTFLASRVREAVSVPAPRRAVRAAGVGRKKGGILYYVATTRATPGAPPRKLSGKLRQSIWSKMVSPTRAVIGANARGYPSGRYPQGANYPRILEKSVGSRRHAFIAPTLVKYRREIRTILGRQMRLALK